MKALTQLKTTIPPLLVAFVLGCFALAQTARAVIPAPDGGYPGNNTAEGDNALFSLTTGTENTAIGSGALYSNIGSSNTATGSGALSFNTTGSNNTATGSFALIYNTTGNFNTANGVVALESNTTGSENTANGVQALVFNTTGNFNTATGVSALLYNTTGSNNTATGVDALYSNTIGSDNTANGNAALYSNTTGIGNTATGVDALYANTTGYSNTATGFGALNTNTTGYSNTATGFGALNTNATGYSNTAIGYFALLNATGSDNIGLGFSAGINRTTGSNNIDIGNQGVAAEASTIRIGTQGTQTATFIAGISGTPIGGGGSTVRVNANGQLGTAPSAARFKQNIKPMNEASEAILALKPVTFRYRKELDPDGIPQFGLVAEEVEKIDPALVVRDADGKPYTVRYDAVNAMLLNEFLKEHRKNEEQEATIVRQQKQIEALAAGLKEQKALIQKVSDKVEVSRPAPQMALNNE
jgi:hypothetical protein